MAKKEGSSLLETVKTVFYALVIALLFRTILFQPFWIPSGSMKSTLLCGDYLFISKYAYGYSQASCPTVLGVNLCPFLSGRIFASEPERGDVIVFKHPTTGEDYIKRLVGMPGETIQLIDGALHIDGEAVPMRDNGSFLDPARDNCVGSGRSRRDVLLESHIETLPGGRQHVTLNTGDNYPFDNTPAYEVPEGHFFMMGDHRDNSLDSRDMSRRGVGFVPFESLVGRAEVIAVSAGGPFWALWQWRFGRTLNRIE
jgi:signal peptidase I